LKTKEKLSDNHKIHQRYISTLTGIEYPGGSTIAGLLDKGFGMVISAVSLTKKGYDFQKIWNEKKEAGTLLHDMIRGELINHKFDMSSYTPAMTERATNSFSKFLKWESEHIIEDMFCEEQIISETLKAGGTADLRAIIDKFKTLADYKSGKINKKTGKPYEASFVQASGYAKIEEENGHPIDRILLLCLPQDKEDNLLAYYLTDKERYVYTNIFVKLCGIYWDRCELQEDK